MSPRISGQVDIDTIKTIIPLGINSKEITIEIPNGKVFLSKPTLVEFWENVLTLYEEENLNHKQKIKDNWWSFSNKNLEYLKNHDRITLKLKGDTDYEKLPPETDTLFFMANDLKEIACNLIEIGEFEIEINGVKQNEVLKAKVRRYNQYSETIKTEYIVCDSIFFWWCPPIIHSDFYIENGNYPAVPQPPTIEK